MGIFHRIFFSLIFFAFLIQFIFFYPIGLIIDLCKGTIARIRGKNGSKKSESNSSNG